VQSAIRLAPPTPGNVLDLVEVSTRPCLAIRGCGASCGASSRRWPTSLRRTVQPRQKNCGVPARTGCAIPMPRMRRTRRRADDRARQPAARVDFDDVDLPARRRGQAGAPDGRGVRGSAILKLAPSEELQFDLAGTAPHRTAPSSMPWCSVFLNALLDRFIGKGLPADPWSVCSTCTAQHRCTARHTDGMRTPLPLSLSAETAR
jgi:hypothetical protein